MSGNSNSAEEQQIKLERLENVFIITFTGSPHPANVFNIRLLRHLSGLLDEVEEEVGMDPCCLVFIGRGEKFFSAGFDLKALTGVDPAHSKELVEYSWKVLARLLVFPAPTIACFNGHAFGLGLFVGLACDHRVMTSSSSANKKGGRLCMPEINIGLPLGRGFAQLSKCKLNKNTLRTAALTGKQYTSQEALNAGIIDAVVSPLTSQRSSVIPKEVLEMAESLVPTASKGNLSSIKMELYHETHDILLQGYLEQDEINATAGRSKL